MSSRSLKRTGGRIPGIAELAEAGIAVAFDDSPAHMHHKFALFDETGKVHWKKNLGPGVIPGGWFTPVLPFDLDGDDDFRLGALFYRLLMRVGHPRLTRDLELFHRRLTETGRAAWLGESLSKVRSEPLDDLARAVTRVKALVTSRDSRNA